MAIDTGGQHDELTQSRATVCIKLADIKGELHEPIWIKTIKLLRVVT